MKLLRSLVRLVGRGLLGGAVFCFVVALALCAVGAYCIAVPAARVSRRHEQLVAFVRVAQAVAAFAAIMQAGRRADASAGEPELAPDEPRA